MALPIGLMAVNHKRLLISKRFFNNKWVRHGLDHFSGNIARFPLALAAPMGLDLSNNLISRAWHMLLSNRIYPDSPMENL
jgi:hypothetical protein